MYITYGFLLLHWINPFARSNSVCILRLSVHIASVYQKEYHFHFWHKNVRMYLFSFASLNLPPSFIWKMYLIWSCSFCPQIFIGLLYSWGGRIIVCSCLLSFFFLLGRLFSYLYALLTFFSISLFAVQFHMQFLRQTIFIFTCSKIPCLFLYCSVGFRNQINTSIFSCSSFIFLSNI